MSAYNKRIHILGIVPYPELRQLMTRIAAEQEDIDLDCYVGDYRDCIRILEENLDKDYQVIMSRGGTARELAARIRHIPMVDISVSFFDILRALQLGKNAGVSCAVVGFPALTDMTKSLCRLLHNPIPVHTASSEEDTRALLERLYAEGCEMILCGVVAYQLALDMHLQAILITSGKESIHAAFDEARRLTAYYQESQEELVFYKNILKSHRHHTVILGADGHIIFSTADGDLTNKVIANSLKEQSLSRKYGHCSYRKYIDQTPYDIRCTCTEFRSAPCFSFEFFPLSLPVKIDRYGISYVHPSVIEEDLQSTNILSLLRAEDMEALHSLHQSDAPVLIYGDPFSYKSIFAKYLYSTGAYKTHPLVLIDCGALGARGWQFLIGQESSPLNSNGSTILIDNITLLAEERRQYLLNYMISTYLCRRNRVYFIHTISGRSQDKTFLSELLQELHCQLYRVPRLDELTDQLERYISLFFGRRNLASSDPVTEVTPDALNLLRQYSWPYQYKQLDRCLEALHRLTTHGIVEKEMVQSVLAQEDILLKGADEGDTVDSHNRDSSNDEFWGHIHKKTLTEMNQAIVERVLGECGGNQTETAQRLGIGRTTLWRMLK